ncbi:cation diffusion facilitator CzcD-associated flavoprotein CzcO [Prauserella sediminis]|uniref:Cation diffusion facilitator CzcD-associated flavoprotein CzcO n=1 Tax=Prauserella sediminis TaxID=577680 RepID=A0A839XVS7_9PSEU|nr:NAD(P)/FAD-dependent oxidoreductase [Prauserella sediminis]MBB3665484.1 cation diffusion facilitator CzcD-associated flavoprotein CzcO [Prauserella sediminis]
MQHPVSPYTANDHTTNRCAVRAIQALELNVVVCLNARCLTQEQPTSDEDDARMPDPRSIPATELWSPEDLETIRARYRAERDKRLRPDGTAQYLQTADELAAYADDPWSDPPAAREPVTDEIDAVVLGAGFSGLLAGAHLRKAGLSRIRLVDTAGGVGGTWYWNRYPGVACDIESYIYLPLLEEVGGMPSRKYAPGWEIRQHAERIAEHFDLGRDALLHTAVTSLHWDDELSRWHVRTDHGDAFTARYAVISSGLFGSPKLPGIPGIDRFEGRAFHTSRWDYDCTGGSEDVREYPGLRDKRVAIVGTGATSIQVVPTIAPDCGELLVVQRTPSTVDRRDDRPTDPDWWAEITKEPGWQRVRRDNFITLVTGGAAGEDLVQDQWTDTAPVRGRKLLMSGQRGTDPALAFEIADHQKMAEMRARVGEIVSDSRTATALQPWYRHLCKRPCFSDSYLQTFNRDNVRLVDTDGHGVERITPKGIVVAGTEHPVDVLIFGTGFEVGADAATRSGADIRGRAGLPLEKYWANGARTLHGATSRGFPNLIQLVSSRNVVSVNYGHILEDRAEHLGAMVAEAEKRSALIEPTEAAESAWSATISAKAIDTDAFQAECTPGYFNEEGKPRKRNERYGGNPVEFNELIRHWIEDGMDDVLSA